MSQTPFEKTFGLNVPKVKEVKPTAPTTKPKAQDDGFKKLLKKNEADRKRGESTVKKDTRSQVQQKIAKTVGFTPQSGWTVNRQEAGIGSSLESEMHSWDIQNFGVATFGDVRNVPKDKRALWQARQQHRARIGGNAAGMMQNRAAGIDQMNRVNTPVEADNNDPISRALGMGGLAAVSPISAFTTSLQNAGDVLAGRDPRGTRDIASFLAKTTPNIEGMSDAELYGRAAVSPLTRFFQEPVSFARAGTGDTRTSDELSGLGAGAEFIGNIIPQMAAGAATGGASLAGKVAAGVSLDLIPIAQMVADMGGIQNLPAMGQQLVATAFDETAPEGARVNAIATLGMLGLGATAGGVAGAKKLAGGGKNAPAPRVADVQPSPLADLLTRKAPKANENLPTPTFRTPRPRAQFSDADVLPTPTRTRARKGVEQPETPKVDATPTAPQPQSFGDADVLPKPRGQKSERKVAAKVEPTPVTNPDGTIFVRKPNAKEARGGVSRSRGMFEGNATREGYERVYKPYGEQGAGYYDAPLSKPTQPRASFTPQEATGYASGDTPNLVGMAKGKPPVEAVKPVKSRFPVRSTPDDVKPKTEKPIPPIKSRKAGFYEKLTDAEVLKFLRDEPKNGFVVRQVMSRSKEAGFRSPTSWVTSIEKKIDAQNAAKREAVKSPQERTSFTPKEATGYASGEAPNLVGMAKGKPPVEAVKPGRVTNPDLLRELSIAQDRLNAIKTPEMSRNSNGKLKPFYYENAVAVKRKLEDLRDRVGPFEWKELDDAYADVVNEIGNQAPRNTTQRVAKPPAAPKQKQEVTLQASDSTLKGIEESVNKFYYSDGDFKVVADGDGYKITKRGEVIQGVRVTKKGDRFRFESVKEPQSPQEPPAAPSKGVEAKGKEPWEMTVKEFRESPIAIKYKDYKTSNGWVGNTLQTHMELVNLARLEGKPVPAEVLADYPDLVAKVAPTARQAKGVAGVSDRLESTTTNQFEGSVNQARKRLDDLNKQKTLFLQTYKADGGDHLAKLKLDTAIGNARNDLDAEVRAYNKRNAELGLPPIKAPAAGKTVVTPRQAKGAKLKETFQKFSDEDVIIGVKQGKNRGSIARINPEKVKLLRQLAKDAAEYGIATLDEFVDYVGGMVDSASDQTKKIFKVAAKQVWEAEKGKATPVAKTESTPKATPDRVVVNRDAKEGQSLRQADTKLLRESLGKDPLAKTPKKLEKLVTEIRDSGMIDRAEDIANDVILNPRPMSDTETAAVLVRFQETVGELDAKTADLAKAVEANSVAETLRLSDEVTALQNRAYVLADASDKAGSEWGRAGRARQLLAKKGYSNVELNYRAIVANKKALSPAQLAEQRELSSRIESLQKQYDESQTMAAKLQDENAKLIEDLKVKSVLEAVSNRTGTSRRRGRPTAQAEAEASKRVAEAWKKVLSGNSGAVGSMFGGLEGPASAIFKNSPELANALRDLIVIKLRRMGAKSWNKDVYDEIRSILPEGLTEKLALEDRDIRDILIRAYDEVPTGRTDAARQITALQQQAKLLNEIDDVRAGKSVSAAKARRAASPEVQALRKELDELKRPDKEAARTKATLEKRINTLNREIALLKKGDEIAKKPRSAKNPQVAKLEAERNRLQRVRKLEAEIKAREDGTYQKPGSKPVADEVPDSELRELQGKLSKLRDMERDAAKKQRIEDEIQALEDMKARQYRTVKAPKKPITYGELTERKRLLRQDMAIQDRIANLKEQVRTRTFKKEDPKVTAATKLRDEYVNSPERLKLNRDLRVAKSEADAWVKHLAEKAKRDKMIPAERIFWDAIDATGLPRAIMASSDISAPLRQGAVMIVTQPKASMRALGRMFGAIKSDAKMAEIESLIISKYEESGRYADMLDGKLAIQGADQGGIHPTHEDFATKLIDVKVGGIRPFGIIKTSERAMVTFLNSVRMDAFDKLATALEADGVKLTKEEMQGIAYYVNISTGAGNIAPLGKVAPVMSKLFFAPSFWASRIQYLIGMPIKNAGSSRVRMQIAKEYAKFYSFASVVLGLAAINGWTTADARDSGFGDLKLSNQVPPEVKPYLVMMLNIVGASASNELGRVDVTGGLGTHVTALTRMTLPFVAGLTGQKVAPMVTVTGEERKSSNNATLSYLRSRLAPIPGLAVTLANRDEETGMPKNVIGQKMDADDMARTMLMPLTFSQLYEDLGLPGSPKKEPFGSAKKENSVAPTTTDFSNMTNEELAKIAAGAN